MSVPAQGQPIINAAHQTNPYIEYSLVTDYLYVSGTLAIPVAYVLNAPPATGTRQAQEIVQLSQPYSQRIVTFAVSRLNAAPTVPAIDTLSNERLRSARVSTHAPAIGSDATTRVYRVTGQYIYDHIVPVYATDTLDMGANVADSAGPDQFTLEATQFKSLATKLPQTPNQATVFTSNRVPGQ